MSKPLRKDDNRNGCSLISIAQIDSSKERGIEGVRPAK